MRPIAWLRLILAASFVLGVAGATSAQVKVGGYSLEGDIEAGGRYVDSGAERRQGKFEEYRDFNSGLFLENLKLRLFTPDERYSVELGGSKWGLETQEYSLRSGRLGLWEFGFDWDQMRHVYATTGRTPYVETSRGVWALPNPRRNLTSFNSAPELDEISARWDTAKIAFKLTPTADTELSVAYTRIRKDGDRPLSMSFGTGSGNNSAQVLEPIEQTVHDVRFQAVWARQNWQLQFDYTFSLFDNDLRSMTVDNPCFGLVGVNLLSGQCGATDGAGSYQGRVALAPGNSAHTFTLAGGVNLPLRTRITANVSYSLQLQDETFLPHTISTTSVVRPELALPQNSLNGNVQTLLGNLNVTSRPFRPLTLGLKYRYSSLKDESDVIWFGMRFLDDRSITTGGHQERFSHSRHNLDLDARYQILGPLAATIGVGWERWDRVDHRFVAETDEFFGKAAFDYQPFNWLLARLTYRPSFRVNDGYNDRAAAPAFTPRPYRNFDLSERNRHPFDGTLQFTPGETVTVALTGGYRYDDYLDVKDGVQYETTWSAGADVAWTPTERFSVGAGYVRELVNRQQSSHVSITNPQSVWLTENIDTVDTFFANAKATLIPKTLDFVVTANASTSYGRSSSENPRWNLRETAANFASNHVQPYPAFDDTLIRVESKLLYHFLKNWTASLGYAYESFEKHDFRSDKLTPWITGIDSIWLGTDMKGYTAHIIGATLRYRF